MKYSNVEKVIRHDICTGCGICIGTCNKGAISITVKDGHFLPEVNNGKCVECGLCIKSCPGVGCEISKLSTKFLTDATKDDKIVGRYEQCFVGHSTDYDLRYHSASGGMVTQLLVWLLETERIDGAVVTKFDCSKPFMTNTFIATSKEELVDAKSSKYAPVSFHEVAGLIKKANGTRYVIVGLPCHVQGLRKQMEWDKVLEKKVVALFGLYCSCGRTFYLTEHVFRERKIDRSRLTYFAYRDEGCLGSMVAKQGDEVYTEDFQKYYHPLRSFFIPKRCLFCVDHYAQLADISFGDIHIKPYSNDKVGINSIVVRNQKMSEWLQLAKSDGVITLDVLDVTVLNNSQRMARRKFNRVGAYLKIASFFGDEVPRYDLKLPVKNIVKYVVEYCHTRVQQRMGMHKCMWGLITLLKSRKKHV